MAQDLVYNNKSYQGISYVEVGGKRFQDVDEGVTPVGSVNITSNGSYDVSRVKTANVNVQNTAAASGTLNITANGTYDISKYAYVKVDIAAVGSRRVTGQFKKESKGTTSSSQRVFTLIVNFEGEDFTSYNWGVQNAKWYNDGATTSGNVPSSYITVSNDNNVTSVSMYTNPYQDVNRYFSFDMYNYDTGETLNITMSGLTYGTDFNYTLKATKTSEGYVLSPA